MEEVFIARPVRANRGDMASQAGLVSAFLRHPVVHSVTVSTYYPHHYSGYNYVNPTTPPPLRGYATSWLERKALKRSSVIAWGGGVDLEDGGSKSKLLLLNIKLALLKTANRPLIQAFQGAGPLNTSSGRWLAKLAAELCDYHIVRENNAMDLLRCLGVDSRELFLGCDAALLLDSVNAERGRYILSRKGLDPDAPTLGLNLRRWYHQSGGWIPTGLRKGAWNGSEVFMSKLIKNIRTSLREVPTVGVRQLLLLPMYLHDPEPWEDDIALLERSVEQLEGFAIARLYEDLSPQDILSVLSCVSLMVGMRLHSTIMAHVAGTPAIHIAYADKGRDYFSMMGLSSQYVDVDDMVDESSVRALIGKIEAMIVSEENIQADISSRVGFLRAQGERALDSFLRSVLLPDDADG